MKKKQIICIAAALIAAAGVAMVCQAPKWSEKTFKAIVEKVDRRAGGEIRLIVRRTTEIYGDPVNSLCIGSDTKLLDANSEKISPGDFLQGDTVIVTLKDSFIEETPFYYPTVYEIKIFR